MVSVAVPSLKMPPPPSAAAELLSRVQLVSVSVPSLKMPPPMPEVLPWVMARWLMVTVPLVMSNTSTGLRR